MGNALVGLWCFVGIIYQGNFSSKPNPALIISYSFDKDSTNDLLYFHKDEHDHCERKAQFTINKNIISQKITWVDPKNTMQCSTDTDMQLGNLSELPFQFKNNQLITQFPLGDETLSYVWEKATSNNNCL